MNMDLRIPMGMMFSMMGTILMTFGFVTNTRPEFYTRSLGIDVNLWWGLVLLLFGLWLTTMGRRGQARIDKAQSGAPNNGLERRRK